MYLTTERGMILTLSAFSFAYCYVKTPSTRGHLTILKGKFESQSETFIYKINP